MANPIICALDTTDLDGAVALSGAIRAHVGGAKLGKEFLAAHGPQGVRRVAASGLPLFLDVKFHDIPNTVAGAIRGLLPLKPAIVNVHAAGGPAMLKAACEAAATAGAARPWLIAVTVLTSLDDGDLAAIGQRGPVEAQVVRLARLAQSAGCDGVVCAPQEIAAIRQACGAAFKLVVPGIRPSGSDSGDQKRVMGPAEALAAGADRLVIGRPITAAPEPATAAAAIAASLGRSD
jgi:orotidine-5'-phosphate decarboxylase